MKKKLRDIARGTYFRYLDSLYLIIEHHQDLAEVISFDNDGRLIALTRTTETNIVDIVGTTFQDCLSK